MFDEEGFRAYLQDQRKPANTTTQFMRLVTDFFTYLQQYRPKSVDNQQAEDLHEFFAWLDQKHRRPTINRYFYALKFYYGFLSKPDLYYSANEILGIISLEALKLKDFVGIESTVAKTLASHDIRTAAQLLALTRTKAERAQLSEQTNIPEASLLEIVKLSNLARIPGLKQKRARLFYDAGLDTLDKITTYKTPEDLVTFFAKYVDHTRFNERAVSLAEAKLTLGMAKHLHRIIEL